MDSPSEYPTFYVDDSITEIGGKKHVILAAITFPDEDQALTEWLSQKSAFGLPAYQEVKWGSKSVSIEKRREFVPILNKGTGIVVIYEGNQQAAALKLMEQIWSYSEQEKKKGFKVRFDKGIVQDWPELRKIAASYFSPCVGLSDHDSAGEQLVQCADFLAGSVKLKIDFGRGVRDQNQKIDDPEIGSTEIGFFFFAALRYCLWGEVKDYGDGIETFMPLKHTRNKGLVVVSSIANEVLESATALLDGDYMGCIH
ncbi:MAG: DUF3800 domain-containing protein [Acidobacteriia bacterium]|nr:DUF3800 domain-containing protein [Terriglobia bacterium]